MVATLQQPANRHSSAASQPLPQAHPRRVTPQQLSTQLTKGSMGLCCRRPLQDAMSEADHRWTIAATPRGLKKVSQALKHIVHPTVRCPLVRAIKQVRKLFQMAIRSQQQQLPKASVFVVWSPCQHGLNHLTELLPGPQYHQAARQIGSSSFSVDPNTDNSDFLACLSVQ
ncbi:MAG: hypothetical protein U5L74_11780 [Ideonella sp.]|nr:hypothetical protein [Ideonella sp.]